MRSRLVPMSSEVMELATLALERMGLKPAYDGEKLIMCPLRYEDGTTVDIVIMCTARARFLRADSRQVTIAFAVRGEAPQPVEVLHRDQIPMPTRASDMQFYIHLIARIKSIAWTLAAITKMGACTDLPNTLDTQSEYPPGTDPSY